MTALLPSDLRAFRKRWKLDSTNTLTLTNPKVLKSASIAPTAVLHLLPTEEACPFAGACRALCLNRAGNPAYLTGKLACRQRRDRAFQQEPNRFLQNMLVEVFRFYRRNDTYDLLGVRLNGTSDYLWEHIKVEVSPALSTYLHHQLQIGLRPGTHTVMSALTCAYDGKDEMPTSRRLRMYDYTKRPDRAFEACRIYGYDLTLSHGGKVDLLPLALEHRLNYAVAFDIKKNQPLPESVSVGGRVFTVLDGDVTDWRPGDADHATHIVGLRIKRTPGQTQAQRDAFCLPRPVREPVAA